MSHEDRPRPFPRMLRIIFAGVGLLGGLAARRLLGALQEEGTPFEALLVDPDRIDEDNTRTQGYAPSQVGEPKVLVLGQELSSQLSPGRSRIVVRPDPLELVGGFAWEGADIVVLALDSERARLGGSRRALRAGWSIVVDTGIHLTWGRVTNLGSSPLGGGTEAYCYGCRLPAHLRQELLEQAALRISCRTGVRRIEPTRPTRADAGVAAEVAGRAAGSVQNRLAARLRCEPDPELGVEYRLAGPLVRRMQIHSQAGCHPLPRGESMFSDSLEYELAASVHDSGISLRELASEVSRLTAEEVHPDLDMDVVTLARCNGCQEPLPGPVVAPALPWKSCSGCQQKSWSILGVAPRGQGGSEVMDRDLKSLDYPLDHPVAFASRRGPWRFRVRFAADRTWGEGA